jgi:hypothetical protein
MNKYLNESSDLIFPDEEQEHSILEVSTNTILAKKAFITKIENPNKEFNDLSVEVQIRPKTSLEYIKKPLINGKKIPH